MSKLILTATFGDYILKVYECEETRPELYNKVYYKCFVDKDVDPRWAHEEVENYVTPDWHQVMLILDYWKLKSDSDLVEEKPEVNYGEFLNRVLNKEPIVPYNP